MTIYPGNSKNIFADNVRHCILIGGYPGSGKTEFAKFLLGNLDNYLLIDDISSLKELDWHIRDGQDKLIITDPNLSYKKNIKLATKLLREYNFKVTSLILMEESEICCARVIRRTGKKKFVTGKIKEIENELKY